jgi:hypothetical protein
VECSEDFVSELRSVGIVDRRCTDAHDRISGIDFFQPNVRRRANRRRNRLFEKRLDLGWRDTGLQSCSDVDRAGRQVVEAVPPDRDATGAV